MYNGIGLTTPRGSGTSGYVVRNLSTLRSYQNDRDRDAGWDAAPPKHREPDQGILEHERKRAVEVKCLELQVRLENEEVDEAEIEKQVSALREKLLANLNSSQTNVRGLKPSDTHALAAAKKVELEKMARALGTRNDYQEGDSFDKEKQEDMRLKRIAEREDRDRRRAEDTQKFAEQKARWEAERRKRDDDRRRHGDRDRPRDNRGMAPPPLPTGPRGGPPPRDRDDGYRPRDRSPPPRTRDVDMRDRSPPPRSRKRSPSHSPSPSRSRSPGYARHKRRAGDRSISPPRRRSRTPDRRDRRRRASSSPSRSPRGRSNSRSSSGSRADSRSRSRSRSPYGGRRGIAPPPSASRKPPVPVPTPGYTRDKEMRDARGDRVPAPQFNRNSPPRGGPPGRGGRDRERSRSPPLRRRSPSPPPRGRTPEKRPAGGRGRSSSSGTGSSMSVSSGSRSRSRD